MIYVCTFYMNYKSDEDIKLSHKIMSTSDDCARNMAPYRIFEK